jgi:hypothetical protein
VWCGRWPVQATGAAHRPIGRLDARFGLGDRGRGPRGPSLTSGAQPPPPHRPSPPARGIYDARWFGCGRAVGYAALPPRPLYTCPPKRRASRRAGAGPSCSRSSAQPHVSAHASSKTPTTRPASRAAAAIACPARTRVRDGMIEIPGRLAYDATQVGRRPLQACPLGCGHHDLRGEERGWLVRSAGRRSSPGCYPRRWPLQGALTRPLATAAPHHEVLVEVALTRRPSCSLPVRSKRGDATHCPGCHDCDIPNILPPTVFDGTVLLLYRQDHRSATQRCMGPSSSTIQRITA